MTLAEAYERRYQRVFVDDWHALEHAEVLARLGTDPENGLTPGEVEKRLRQYGANELLERGLKNPWRILWEQLTGLMVLILIGAAAVSVVLGDYSDAIVILIIVVLNAALGFSQEYRAEKAIAALKQLAVPHVRVRRNGEVQEISARELVPGDLVLLEAGNLVPADGRLLESHNLRVQEAALTGESEPVDKHVGQLPADLALADRRNMVYMGTTVSYGRGMMVVTETGMRTQLGRIAEMIQGVSREPTPLQRRLEQLSRGLALAVAGIVAVVFVLGVLRGEDLHLMVLTAVGMAVAAVPEGLPAVVTIGLALGTQRMLKRRALIRKLQAVETLGSVNVICSDKTGTLTENRMTVTVLDVAGQTLSFTETLARGRAVWLEPADAQRAAELAAECGSLTSSLRLLLTGAALCNDAILQPVHAGSSTGWRALGDPTEGALVVAAAQVGLAKDELERMLPRQAEVPFTSERKRMTTLHHLQAGRESLPDCLTGLDEANWLIFSKGAVDQLLAVSGHTWVDGDVLPLNEEWRARIEAANARLAQSGMRVLGVAFRPLSQRPSGDREEDLERDLIFVGLVGMIDPPRPEVKAAVAICREAGIRPIMITGDHPLTAQHIAQQLGISTDGTQLLTGKQLDVMTVEQLEGVIEHTSVFARVSPEHKLKIVQALQDRGHVVAMTGDGVNDAPALRKADIGVAMGITGTDVAKEAADMVLLDDNFATIVSAVEEGRIVYDNIRKFVKYTLTSNAGEIWVMLLGPFLGMPLALLPLQILWVNLVTDGLPGLGLAMEPAESGTMQRPPYRLRESIFGRGLGIDIVWVGLLMGLVSLGVGLWGWLNQNVTWQTMVFTTLTLSQMGNALAIRSERDSLFRIGFRSNRMIWAAVLLTFVLQLAVVYVPWLQEVFHTVALPPHELLISLAASTLVFWGIEMKKWLARRARSQG